MSLMPTGSPCSGSARELLLFDAPARRVEVERGEGADLALVRGDRLGAELDHGAR